MELQHYHLSFIGHKIWSLVPSNIKSSDTLKKFEHKSMYWRPDTCPCKPTLKDLDIY